MDEMKENIQDDVTPPTGFNEKDNRLWAMLCHLSTFAGFIIPFGNIIAPLILWLIKKDELPLVDDQGKEAINFQISMTIYMIIAIVLIFIIIGFVIVPLLFIFDVVITVLAAIKANDGERFRYPLSIRLIR